jgi:hypothetical protein
MEVDELSIKKWKMEPVRMRFQCRYPERVKGTVQLCVNGETFTVGIHAELGAAGAGGSSGPPRPPAPRDDDDGDDLESEERSTDGEAWNRHRRRGSDKEKAKGSDKQGGGPGYAQLAGIGGSRSAPQLGKVADQYGSNIKVFPRLASLGRFAILAEGDDVVTLGKEGGGPPPALPTTVVEEVPLASGETVSQITEVVGSGLRSSPTVEPASPTWTSSARVADAPADSMVVSVTAAVQGPGPELDLHGEVTAAVSLVQGKRTKVVPVSVKGPAKATKKTKKDAPAADAAEASADETKEA